MLGLREHVGRDVARIGVIGDDDYLRGSGDKIDSHFAGEQLLRGGDVNVARTNDTIYFGNGRGAEGERGDGLRAANPEDVRCV